MLKKYLPAIIAVAVIGTSVPILSGMIIPTQPDEPTSIDRLLDVAESGKVIIPTQPDEPADVIVTPLDKDALSKFPRPSAPPENLVDRGMPLRAIKAIFPYANDMPQVLPTGEKFVYGLYNPVYDEATLYYADSKIHSLLKNEHSTPDMLDFGMIVFDYERLENLSDRRDRQESRDYHTQIHVPSESPAFVINGHSELDILYVDDGIELRIFYKDATPEELEAFVKELDL